MTYKINVTYRADQHLANIVHYVADNLNNKSAAASILDDVERAYEELEHVAGSLGYCEDPYLAKKGYRKIALAHHDYVLLYQIEEDIVYVNGIFHMLENYRDKL